MKALVFHKPKDVRVETVPDPSIEEATDVVLRVTATAICGSDLHIYNGFLPQPKPMVLGHEFMGIVEEVGKGVKRLKVGDRVVVPFPIACGSCWFCTHDHYPGCSNSNKNYGPDGGIVTEKGAALFGYTDLYGGYSGGQAELVRVPYADAGPRKVPETLTDEQVLFLTDILPTGWSAVDMVNLKAGETVVVFGCGPVGLMAMKAAWLKGASRVIGLDVEQYRCEMAQRTTGSETILVGKNVDEVIEQVRAKTEGRGADVAVDAVGMETSRGLIDKAVDAMRGQPGDFDGLEMAMRAVRRGGRIGVVGVYGADYNSFPLGRWIDKGITIWGGQAPVHKYIDELLAHVVAGRLKLDDIITHRLPLAEAAKGYQVFNDKKDGCVKVVMSP